MLFNVGRLSKELIRIVQKPLRSQDSNSKEALLLLIIISEATKARLSHFLGLC